MDSLVTHNLVAGGGVAIAVAAVLWALRVTEGARGAERRWHDKADGLEDKLQRWDSVFGAFPGLALIWEADPLETPAQEAVKDVDWGEPRIYGSPLALASLLRFSDAAVAEAPPVRILQGLATFKGRDGTGQDAYLAPLLSKLRRDGQPFSLTISSTDGLYVEIDGRTAGARAVVWILDASVKGVEEGGAQGKLDEARQVIARDPAAFLELLARAPFMAWRLSSGLKLEWANQAYIQALDAKTLDHALQRNLMLDALTQEQARRAIEAGGDVSETRHVVVRGERRALKIVMMPLAGGIGGMAFDMTDAEAAREALERAERAQDQTLDALAEGVVVFGADRRLAFCNQAFANLWGLDPAFLAERPSHAAWLDALKEKRKLPGHAFYPDWRANELLAYQERADLQETLWPLPDGRLLRVAKRRHPNGGLLIIFTDMTKEATLKGQYTALLDVQRAALDRLHEAIVVFGLDGRTRLSNAAFREMWKIDPEVLEGEPDYEVVVEACMKLFHNRAEWVRVKGRITDPSPQARRDYEGEMRRSDGSILKYLSRPLPNGDTLLAFQDVTAERRVEEALRQRAEAFETADRLKTELVENVSYQLRTPLQTIQGYAEVLARFMAGPLNDRQRDQLQMILSASESLSRLVDNVLDVALVEAGRLELELVDVGLSDLVAEAIGMAQTKARDSDITLKRDVAANAGVIRADGKRLKQALVSLISNSLRFTPGGGAVTVGAQRMEGAVRLWVSDTGAGVPYDQQVQAFDQFTSGDRRGAGLGLALVRSFVELHHGWLGLQSDPGAGTTVNIFLPLEAGDGARNAA